MPVYLYKQVTDELLCAVYCRSFERPMTTMIYSLDLAHYYTVTKDRPR